MASGAELMKGCVYAAAMLSEKEAGEDEEAVTVRKANRLFRLLRAAASGASQRLGRRALVRGGARGRARERPGGRYPAIGAAPLGQAGRALATPPAWAARTELQLGAATTFSGGATFSGAFWGKR